MIICYEKQKDNSAIFKYNFGGGTHTLQARAKTKDGKTISSNTLTVYIPTDDGGFNGDED